MENKSAVLLIMAAGLLSTMSCQKDDLQPFDIALQADKTAITVDQYNDDVAFTLTWNEVSAGDVTPTYFVEFTDDTDLEFMSSYVIKIEDGSTSLAVTNSILEEIHNTIGAVSDYGLITRVRVEGADYAQSISNQAKIAVTLNLLPTFDLLYLCGVGCDAGWEVSGILTMENNDMVFTWTGHLYPVEGDNAGRGFRFNTTIGEWAPCLVLSLEEEGKLEYCADGVFEYVGDGQGEPDPTTQEITVDTDGTYTITVDATDLKNITYTCELVEAN